MQTFPPNHLNVGLDNGIVIKILAMSGNPEAWMTSQVVTHDMVGVITREQWDWKGVLEMIMEMTHYERCRQPSYIHYYGIELLVRYSRKHHETRNRRAAHPSESEDG